MEQYDRMMKKPQLANKVTNIAETITSTIVALPAVLDRTCDVSNCMTTFEGKATGLSGFLVRAVRCWHQVYDCCNLFSDRFAFERFGELVQAKPLNSEGFC
jgi:hypothetical protein